MLIVWRAFGNGSLDFNCSGNSGFFKWTHQPRHSSVFGHPMYWSTGTLIHDPLLDVRQKAAPFKNEPGSCLDHVMSLPSNCLLFTGFAWFRVFRPGFFGLSWFRFFAVWVVLGLGFAGFGDLLALAFNCRIYKLGFRLPFPGFSGKRLLGEVVLVFVCFFAW